VRADARHQVGCARLVEMRPALATIVLVVALAACGDGTVADAPPTMGERPPATEEPHVTPTLAVPVDECGEVSIEPGTDGVDWLAATDDPWGFTTLTVAVPNGFVISTEGCVTAVDVDGTLRWSRVTGHVLNSARIGDRIVVLTTPTEPDGAILTAYDAATGQTRWDDTTTTGVWESVTALGDVIVMTGTGEGTLVATVDAETGQVLDTRTGRAGVASVFPLLHDDRVILGATDRFEGRLLAVDPSGALVMDEPVVPRYPVPVAAVGGVVVLQASGVDDDTADVEPPTFLAAHDLATGEERWRLTIEGTHAERAVPIGDTLAMSTSAGITAVDIESGAVRWSEGSTVEQPAMITSLGDEAVAVATAGGKVRVLEVADGVLRWERPIDEVTRLVGARVGDLVVVDGTGRYQLLDGADGSELWAATGPVPTIRDTPPNHRQMVVAGDTYVTIGCPRQVERCERTDQRVVAIRPLRP
jgi:outer membrane protein assembly factor BamB